MRCSVHTVNHEQNVQTSLGAQAVWSGGVHRSASRQSGAGGAGRHSPSQYAGSAMVAHDAPATAQRKVEAALAKKRDLRNPFWM